MKEFWHFTQRYNLVLFGVLLTLLLILSYKAYLLNFESTLKKLALQLVISHSAYNHYLLSKKMSAFDLALNKNINELPLSTDISKSNKEDVKIQTTFWKNFFDSENLTELTYRLSQKGGILVDNLPIDSFGNQLKFFVSLNKEVEKKNNLLIGILLEAHKGRSLDELIDDGLPTSGFIKFKYLVTTDIDFDREPCRLPKFKEQNDENNVACDYVYLF
ncbi:MAG: hypothetical protein VX086_05820 [Pseudomonadota bacterium]|nr:hypothetical protein [Pseudomonadota bacterium]